MNYDAPNWQPVFQNIYSRLKNRELVSEQSNGRAIVRAGGDVIEFSELFRMYC